MLAKIRNKVVALKLAYMALTCPPNRDPKRPERFSTQETARAYLADARGMWHAR